MAKFVLAGKADCPYYAKAENLGDFLQRNLPDFRLHKISVHPSDWQVWLQDTCKLNGWNHSRSPIVWRELIDRGGKGVLLGGFSEFLEHAQGYYDVTSDMSTDLMLKIALENLHTKELTMEEHEEVLKEKALRLLHIWISSALNPVCYSLIPQLFSSSLFPEHKMISLHLVEVGGSDAVLQALKMETEDLASPQLQEVIVHADQNVDFQEADLIVFLDDSMTNLDSMDYQKHVVERFCGYGKLIDANARKTVKVMVAGEACVNLKCSLLAKNAPSVDSRNFVTMSLQREGEAKNLLAQKLFVRSADITDVIVWGNVNGSYHIDLQRAKVSGYDGAVCGPEGFSQGVLEMIYDQKWVELDFERLVQKRQPSIFSKTNRATAMSTTNGIIRTLKAWNDGISPDGVFSLGVVSAGEFGIPEGLVLSMPVSIQEGRWSARTDVTLTDELWPQLEASIEELEKQEQQIGAQVQGLDSDPQRQQ